MCNSQQYTTRPRVPVKIKRSETRYVRLIKRGRARARAKCSRISTINIFWVNPTRRGEGIKFQLRESPDATVFVVHNYFSSTVHFCQLESRFGYVSAPPKAFRFETLSGDMDLTRDKATVLLSPPCIATNGRQVYGAVRIGQANEYSPSRSLLRPVIWIYTLPLRIASCAHWLSREMRIHTCMCTRVFSRTCTKSGEGGREGKTRRLCSRFSSSFLPASF